jgi:hypothetical protein
VRNNGSANAPATLTAVTLGGKVLVPAATDPIFAHDDTTVTVDVPRACWGGGCSYSVEVDSAKAVAESDETNNVLASAPGD